MPARISGLLATLVLLAPPQDGEKPLPIHAMHAGSYGSPLAAKVDRTGRIDTGACVLHFVDRQSGEPIEAPDLGYGKRLRLWLGWYVVMDGTVVSWRVFTLPATQAGSTRGHVTIRVALENPGDQTNVVHLGARIAPGGGDPERRPLPSLPFEEGTSFASEGPWITRDGKALLTWRGLDPDVIIHEPPATAADIACGLNWDVEVPARSARIIELHLAGPEEPGSTADEEGWRKTLRAKSYDILSERLRWQSKYKGTYSSFEVGDAFLREMTVASVHLVRSFGAADVEVRQLSDRPFGHPATDVAVEANLAAMLVEWDLAAITETYLDTLLSDPQARAARLGPARKVAWVHGLARAVRLLGSPSKAERLAQAMEGLGELDVEVEPWIDPATARADLQEVLKLAGVEPEGHLPTLRWATVDGASVAGRMQAVRRGLSEGDAAAAWVAYRGLLDEAGPDGLGSMQPDGQPDGIWPQAMMTLTRALFVDDHGPDLHLLPGVAWAMLPEEGALAPPSLPTRYGKMNIQEYWLGVRHRKVQFTMLSPFTRKTPRIFIHAPGELVVREAIHPYYCDVELQDDGTVEMRRLPGAPNRIAFEMVVEPREP